MTLNDKFFYVSLAMLITALVAAAQWDALALDQRDAAILDPLPVPSGDHAMGQADGRRRRSAPAVALAVNAFPTFDLSVDAVVQPAADDARPRCSG